MRILVHDYPGHAFPVQLSRWLAAQGHHVLHVWCADVESPRGPLAAAPADAPTLQLLNLASGRKLPKYQVVRRWVAERRYARQLMRKAADFKPDVILSNTSPVVQERLLRWSRGQGVRLVSWVQDFYGLPVTRLLQQRLGPLGKLLGCQLQQREFRVLRQSDALVVIAPAFATALQHENVAAGKIKLIPNWPVLKDLPALAKANAWSKQHGLSKKFVFLYAGTLGLKHNPQHLVDLALALGQLPEPPQVVVLSQGRGRAYLEQAKATQSLANLLLLDYQPHAKLPQVLATADVLLSLLEPAAGEFSVPSKILAYLCAGRAQLAAMPANNAAAETLRQTKAGLVVDPENSTELITAALRLYHDASLRQTMGHAARCYAEQAFEIDLIGAEFLAVLQGGSAG